MKSECTELAQAKKLKLGWLGLARRQGQNPSLAWLGLKIILNFWAQLSSGSEELRFTNWARLGLRGSEYFELDPIRFILIKLDLTVKLLLKFIKSLLFSVLLQPVFAKLWSIYLWQSVKSSQKLEPAWAKKSRIGWLGSARKPIENPSQARLGLKSRLDLQAKLGSGLEGSGISELDSARARI